jgi:hypothetical protein
MSRFERFDSVKHKQFKDFFDHNYVIKLSGKFDCNSPIREDIKNTIAVKFKELILSIKHSRDKVTIVKPTPIWKNLSPSNIIGNFKFDYDFIFNGVERELRDCNNLTDLIVVMKEYAGKIEDIIDTFKSKKIHAFLQEMVSYLYQDSILSSNSSIPSMSIEDPTISNTATTECITLSGAMLRSRFDAETKAKRLAYSTNTATTIFNTAAAFGPALIGLPVMVMNEFTRRNSTKNTTKDVFANAVKDREISDSLSAQITSWTSFKNQYQSLLEANLIHPLLKQKYNEYLINLLNFIDDVNLRYEIIESYNSLLMKPSSTRARYDQSFMDNIDGMINDYSSTNSLVRIKNSVEVAPNFANSVTIYPQKYKNILKNRLSANFSNGVLLNSFAIALNGLDLIRGGFSIFAPQGRYFPWGRN